MIRYFLVCIRFHFTQLESIAYISAWNKPPKYNENILVENSNVLLLQLRWICIEKYELRLVHITL